MCIQHYAPEELADTFLHEKQYGAEKPGYCSLYPVMKHRLPCSNAYIFKASQPWQVQYKNYRDMGI